MTTRKEKNIRSLTKVSSGTYSLSDIVSIGGDGVTPGS